MDTVRIFVDDVFLCTVPANRIDNMLLHLQRKGIHNVTVGEWHESVCVLQPAPQAVVH